MGHHLIREAWLGSFRGDAGARGWGMRSPELVLLEKTRLSSGWDAFGGGGGCRCEQAVYKMDLDNWVLLVVTGYV